MVHPDHNPDCYDTPTTAIDPIHRSRRPGGPPMSRATLPGPVALICAPLLPLPALAQEVKTGAGIGITVHGIIGATYYAQDATFGPGNGQKAEFATEELRDASGSR